MTDGIKIGRNVSIVLLGDVVTYALGFIYFAYAARYFGALNFGILSFAIAITSLLAIFIVFGTNLFFIREIARNKSIIPKVIGNSLVIIFFFGFIAFILLTIYLKLFNYQGDTLFVIYIIFISTIISSIKGVFDSIFQALEKPIYISIGKILSTTLFLFGVSSAIIFKLSLIQFSIVYPVINSIILLFFIISTIKHIKIGKWLTFDFSYIKYILKESWPFAVTYAFVSIYVWTDSIMLSIFKGEVEVGYYNVAYRMMLALLFIPVAFNVAVYPVLSRYYTTKSKKSINVIVEKYFSMMVLLGIPISIGTTILSSKIIEIIFGPEYAPAAVVLQILIWSLAFTYMNAPFVKLFESINLQILVTKITGFSALINVIINYLLIPKYSIIGASTATLITEGIVAISLILYSIKLGYFKFNYMKIFKIIIGSLFMGVFLIFINEWNIIISILCSILLYALTLYVLKGIDKEDINLMKSVFKVG